jgi:Ca2+:H+ antiporter
LILIPLVEKAAEHITAIDQAWGNQMNPALAHILGSSLHTALLNTPLVVMVGWGLGIGMDLNFGIFAAVTMTQAIFVVGMFLRDAKTNWL